MAMPPARAPLLSLSDALAQLLATVEPISTTETLATLEADGRVLAEDVVSALHVPPQDNSAMDGYAVRCADVLQAQAQAQGVLQVTQRIAAGLPGLPLAPM